MPAEEVATGLAIVNQFMNLGSAVAVSLWSNPLTKFLAWADGAVRSRDG